MIGWIIVALAVLNFCLLNHGFAQDSYLVKKGESLSNIVKRQFPNDRLYGPKGKLAEVLVMNPHIKNPNFILPNQRIIFVREEIPVRQDAPTLIREAKNMNYPSDDEWGVSALYGAKFISVTQSGALGKVQVGVLFLNDFKINSVFRFKDISIGFNLDSYKFKYETVTSGDSERMYALDLFSSYRWVIGGVGIEQTPLFRNDAGVVEMTKQSLMYLSLGMKKDIQLQAKKPTTLKLKTSFRFPVMNSTDSADIELKSVSGLGLNGQVELSRLIFAQKEYYLKATWISDFGYQKISQNVEWDTSSGESESVFYNFSTALGLLFQF